MMDKRISAVLWSIIILVGCFFTSAAQNNQHTSNWQVIILGVAQDAGYPQANCQKTCCQAYWNGTTQRQYATAIALVNQQSRKAWLFEATPDIKYQLQVLNDLNLSLEGIFLTHAHIGHYTGLMHLGHEVMGANLVPVYAMPRMKEYLETNGPWSQLVNFQNIEIRELQHKKPVQLEENAFVEPFLVPHRDEYSETVGYKITGASKSLIFIPDINKWTVWDTDVREVIQSIDFALVDATFYDENELPGRNIKDIPHPFIIESIELFKKMSEVEKNKIHFIHMNHTNPVMFKSSEQNAVIEKGYKVAFQGQMIDL